MTPTPTPTRAEALLYAAKRQSALWTVSTPGPGGSGRGVRRYRKASPHLPIRYSRVQGGEKVHFTRGMMQLLYHQTLEGSVEYNLECSLQCNHY